MKVNQAHAGFVLLVYRLRCLRRWQGEATLPGRRGLRLPEYQPRVGVVPLAGAER
ncbi:MAG: hypothetical protein PHX35_00605 [Candidatus Bipolaricaulis anaerobius]|nr:hypothetical protein [Candidatus Bipolaricaulis anaerobius]